MVIIDQCLLFVKEKEEKNGLDLDYMDPYPPPHRQEFITINDLTFKLLNYLKLC